MLYNTGDANYPYGLQAPNLGTYTTSNTVGTYKTVYLNAPKSYVKTTDASGFPVGAFGDMMVMFDVYYYSQQGNSISGAVAAGNGGNAATSNNIKRATPFLDSETYSPNGSVFSASGTFQIALMPGLGMITPLYMYVKQLGSTVSLWTNSTTNAYSSNPVEFINNYKNNTITMKYNPLRFTQINNYKIRIDVGFPNMLNSPASSYWIPSTGCSIHIRAGCNSATNDNWYFSDA
jgi:hypothetical protein